VRFTQYKFDELGDMALDKYQ